MKNSSSLIARTEVSVSALTTSSIALCASSVPADFVNAGVWLPPPGSVGIAIAVMNFKAVQIVFSLTISWMKRWKSCRPNSRLASTIQPCELCKAELTVCYISLGTL